MVTRDEAIEGTAELAQLMTLPVEVPERLQIDKPGVYDMPSHLYFRDPVVGKSLTSSGIKKLIEPAGPAKFHYAMTHPSESSEAFDFGRAAHQLVLNDPDDRIVVVEADDWRGKVAREARESARLAGLTPLLAKQFEVVKEMADAILAHPTAAGLLHASSGKPEQTLVWWDHVSGIGCRARVDWLRTPVEGRRLMVVDYKTTVAADPESFGRFAANYGYFVQAAFYLAGVRELGLDPDPAFLLVSQEKDPPYLVSVLEFDETALTLGRNLMRNAINIYADCTRTGEWPGYTPEVQTVSLPPWFLRQFDEE
jgi:hypothetical protein